LSDREYIAPHGVGRRRLAFVAAPTTMTGAKTSGARLGGHPAGRLRQSPNMRQARACQRTYAPEPRPIAVADIAPIEKVLNTPLTDARTYVDD